MNKIKNFKSAAWAEKPSNKDKKIKKLSQKTIELGQASVIHGLGKIFKSESWLIRILWTVCFLSAVGACSYALFSIISKFLKHDVTTKIEMVTEQKTIFPTISICNVNPLVTEEAQQLVLSKYKQNGNFSFENDPEFIENIKWANKLALLHAFDDTNYTDENKKKLGFRLEDILLDCIYNENACHSQDFSWFYDINFGNCYKFNSGYDSSGDVVPLLESKKAGAKNGLRLIFLFGESSNNYSDILNDGLRIMVHNSTAKTPLLQGVDVGLSKFTNIAVQRVFNYKSSYPYSSCIDLTSYDSYYYKLLTKNNLTYQQTDCFDLCLQHEIIKKCDCYDLNYAELRKVKSCVDKEEIKCAFKVYNEFFDRGINEDCLKMCPLECERVSYQLTLSSSNFPSFSSYLIYKNITNLSYEVVRENSLAVNIYYQDLGYTRISETPTMIIQDLLSQIGGTLGLFIGFSLLSLIELLELMLELMFIFLIQ